MPRLASPATESPEMAATASGRNSASSRVSEASATNSPFSVIELKKSGPPPSRPGAESLDRDRDQDGHGGQHDAARPGCAGAGRSAAARSAGTGVRHAACRGAARRRLSH